MKKHGTNGGWTKYPGNPLLGGKLDPQKDSYFDIAMLQKDGEIWLYFSWRMKQSIALVKSTDGIHWTEPVIVLGPIERPDGWEDELNRPGVVYKDGLFYLWYTGQYLPGKENGSSHIFLATSEDGIHFVRKQEAPVISPEYPWEKVAAMCPMVLWNESKQLFQMWYSAGDQYEPNAIGYAESPDGLIWTKYAGNPVFYANPANEWEQHKVTGCQVFLKDDYYYMFYIGFYNEDYAQIGMARSRNGVSDWERSSLNPIIAPDDGNFDSEACYKPFALPIGDKWMLWYNGRTGSLEQIGLVIHEGVDFEF